MKKLSVAIKVAILPLAVLALQTQTANAADGVELTDTGLELTVTANRRVQDINKTLASVTIITRKDIEKNQTQDLVDLLRQQRGISVARTGGAGSQTSVFVRGAESDQVLVLLDGVRIASSTTGFDWSQLPIDQVDRIEIVRGPRAALYGSDAIGGVIEITTRQNSSPYISTTIGKYKTKKLSAGFSGSDEKVNVSLNLSHEESEGFSSKNQNGFGYFADDDGHEKTSVSLSLGAQLANEHKANVQLFQSNGLVEFDDGSFVPDASTSTEIRILQASLSSILNEKWNQNISVSNTSNEFTGFSTKRDEVNWQNNIRLSDNSNIVIGANYRDESGETSSVPVNNIINKGLYASFNQNIEELSFDVSLRNDDHSQAGSKVTGNASLGYKANDKLLGFISYGTGFRAPNINDLYNPGSQFYDPVTFSPVFDDNGDSVIGYKGNVDLKPERSETFEVGLKYASSEYHRFEASLFKTKVLDLIDLSGVNAQAININKANLMGVEFGFNGRVDKFNYAIDFTLLDTEDVTTGKRLLRRPDNKLNLNFGYSVSKNIRIGLDAAIVSSRSDFGIELDSYSVVNLSFNNKLSKRANIGLRIENVTNEEYEYASGFNTPERGAYLTFTYK